MFRLNKKVELLTQLLIQKYLKFFQVDNIFVSSFFLLQPVQLVLSSFPVCKAGRLPSGTTEIPFACTLQSHGTRSLYETYHGVFINIQYFVKVEMKRGLLLKDMEKSCEFIVEYPEVTMELQLRHSTKNNVLALQPKVKEKSIPKPVEFVIVPESVHKLKSKYTVPNFKITGKLDSIVCSIRKPFTGEVMPPLVQLKGQITDLINCRSTSSPAMLKSNQWRYNWFAQKRVAVTRDILKTVQYFR